MQGRGLSALSEVDHLSPYEVWGNNLTLQMRKLKQREVR